MKSPNLYKTTGLSPKWCEYTAAASKNSVCQILSITTVKTNKENYPIEPNWCTEKVERKLRHT